jgi:hypothetical protein
MVDSHNLCFGGDAARKAVPLLLDAGYESARDGWLERFAAGGAKGHKTMFKLAEMELLVSETLRSGGIFVARVAIDPSGAKRPGANWARLHLDGNCTLEPVIEGLIRPG